MLAYIPMRAESRKRNWQVMGEHLVDIVYRAAVTARVELRIVTSDTFRPVELQTDDSPIIDTVRWLHNMFPKEEHMVLLQPTSPFVTPSHIDDCCNGVEFGRWKSAQTVTEVPHVDHWMNQRHYNPRGGSIQLTHAKDRDLLRTNNKQEKPETWRFGNCVAFDIRAAIDQNTCFPGPSKGIPVHPKYCIDVDTELDLEIANLMKKGMAL
jgi:CMP-N-acetylneuraminic acid synthetase